MHSKNDNIIKIALADTGREFRGGQRQSFNLAVGLKSEGLEVLALCSPGSPLIDRLKAEKIPVNPVEYNALKLPFSSHNLAKQLVREAVNIFQASDSHSHTIGAFIKRYCPGIKLVVTVRTCFGKSSPLKNMFKNSNNVVDRFVAISSAVKHNLLNMGIDRERINIIHSSYDNHLFNKRGRTKSDVLRIGTACSLETGKGVYTLLEALKLARELNFNFKLTIAGIGPERDSFEQVVQEYGLEDNVSFCGFVEDMPGFYRNLDIYVLASRSEGLGSSLVEAGACGAVLVSAASGGTADVIDDKISGRIFMPGDAVELSEIITELSQSADLRENLKKEFDKKLKQFDKDNMVRQYIKIYREILES